MLLHANGGDHRDFDAVAPGLAQSGWRVTTLDWPGHGQSPRSEPETAVGFGEVLVRMLDSLGGRHVLLGNSVGGFAALSAAAHRPDSVAGLVLVSPGGFTQHWIGAMLACRAIGSRRVAPAAYRNLPRLYLRARNSGVAAAIERAGQASRSPDRAEVDRRNQQATRILATDLAGTAHPRETARILVLAAADIAARESTQGRRLPAARQALLDVV